MMNVKHQCELFIKVVKYIFMVIKELLTDIQKNLIDEIWNCDDKKYMSTWNSDKTRINNN